EIQLRITFDYDVDSEAEAEELWRGLRLQFSADASRVGISARNPVETGPRPTWRENHRMGIYYKVTVPRRCNLELRTGHGNVTIGRLIGAMSVRVGTGTAFLRQADGD